MAGDKSGSKADTLVKVVLFFFISLLSFSVGTFVGKQVSDSESRRAALMGEYEGDRSVASTGEHGEASHAEHGEATEHGDGGKISEKEVEALTEEFINKEKAADGHGDHGDAHAANDSHGEAKGHEEAKGHGEDGYKAYPRGGDKKETAKHDDHTETPAKKDTHATKTAKNEDHGKTTKDIHHVGGDAPSKAADKVAHDKAPSDGHHEERKPASALPAVASSAVGKYTVQVASFSDEKEAKEHAASLKGNGWNAFYLPAQVNGKTWYRVLVGLFNSQDSAKQFRAQFIKEAGAKSAIVQKIVQ
ncbi:MAG: SPOR domain-containing protein [Bdellovibrionales bacterium]